MRVYAGVDEAGYGPLLGPLTIGRSVFLCPPPEPPEAPPTTPSPPARAESRALGPDQQPLQTKMPPPNGVTQPNATPDLWSLLKDVVGKSAADARRGRIAINDSKKLHQSGAGLTGLRHLERGVLLMMEQAGRTWGPLDQWLRSAGATVCRESNLPWYSADAQRPWETLPLANRHDELAVQRNPLRGGLERAGVSVADVGVAVVAEDGFNRMVQATRSKASVSFTYVSRHLRDIWERWGAYAPVVVVDRQSGRSRYRPLLALAFPEARITIVDESEHTSRYHLQVDVPPQARRTAPGPATLASAPPGGHSMTVSFEVEAEARHLPVALASMTAKYAREILMHRFNAWFAARVPGLVPTAGYASDGKRFLHDLAPHLASLNLPTELWVRER